MKRMIKNLARLVVILLALCILLGISLKVALIYWLTNSESVEDTRFDTIQVWEKTLIPASSWEVHKWIEENGLHEEVEKAYIYFNGTGWTVKRFPENIMKDEAFNFILKGIKKRKVFYKALYEEADRFSIDWDLVLASILPEQIRIATKSSRDTIKKAILYWTPTLFRSDNVSLGIIGMKVETAYQTLKDARNNWTYPWERPENMEQTLMNDEVRQARLAVLTIKNIQLRRADSGHGKSIMFNPWVYWTIYNIGNNKKTKPNASPKMGWSVIIVWGKKYSYWALSMWLYWYLKIFSI